MTNGAPRVLPHQQHGARVAVVTGANQGLGFALGQGLAGRLAPGDVVYLTGRSAARVHDAASRIGAPSATAVPAVLDVRDGGAVNHFADELYRRGSRHRLLQRRRATDPRQAMDRADRGVR